MSACQKKATTRGFNAGSPSLCGAGSHARTLSQELLILAKEEAEREVYRGCKLLSVELTLVLCFFQPGSKGGKLSSAPLHSLLSAPRAALSPQFLAEPLLSQKQAAAVEWELWAVLNEGCASEREAFH